MKEQIPMQPTQDRPVATLSVSLSHWDVFADPSAMDRTNLPVGEYPLYLAANHIDIAAVREVIIGLRQYDNDRQMYNRLAGNCLEFFLAKIMAAKLEAAISGAKQE